MDPDLKKFPKKSVDKYLLNYVAAKVYKEINTRYPISLNKSLDILQKLRDSTVSKRILRKKLLVYQNQRTIEIKPKYEALRAREHVLEIGLCMCRTADQN